MKSITESVNFGMATPEDPGFSFTLVVDFGGVSLGPAAEGRIVVSRADSHFSCSLVFWRHPDVSLQFPIVPGMLDERLTFSLLTEADIASDDQLMSFIRNISRDLAEDFESIVDALREVRGIRELFYVEFSVQKERDTDTYDVSSEGEIIALIPKGSSKDEAISILRD